MKKWQIAISILLVFAIGTAAGAYGSRTLFKKRVTKALRTESSPGIKVLQGMMDRLELSDTQRASINDIIDESTKEWETLREEYLPKIHALYDTVIEKTKTELTGEQQEAIENMSAKVQRRLPTRTFSRPRSSTPPDASPHPRSSGAPETIVPPSKNQPLSPGPDTGQVAEIMEQLGIEGGKTDEIRPIIEEDLQLLGTVRREFEDSQAAAELEYQAKITEIQADTEKKLSEILSPEQLDTYQQLMAPEQPRPDTLEDAFGFEGLEEPMQQRDFPQGGGPIPPGGQPETEKGDARPI